jgi:hypothetical protein
MDALCLSFGVHDDVSNDVMQKQFPGWKELAKRRQPKPTPRVAKPTAALRAMVNDAHNVIAGAVPATSSEISDVEGYVGDRTDRIEPRS